MQLGFEQKNRQMIDLLIMLLTFDKTIIRKVKFYTFKGIFIILKRQLKKQSLKTK